MKKTELQKIIKEELTSVLKEGTFPMSEWLYSHINPFITGLYGKQLAKKLNLPFLAFNETRGAQIKISDDLTLYVRNLSVNSNQIWAQIFKASGNDAAQATIRIKNCFTNPKIATKWAEEVVAKKYASTNKKGYKKEISDEVKLYPEIKTALQFNPKAIKELENFITNFKPNAAVSEEILKELGYGDSSGDFGPTYSPIQVKKELGKMIMDTFKESASVYGPQGQDLSRLGMDLANQLIPKLTKYFEQKFK